MKLAHNLRIDSVSRLLPAEPLMLDAGRPVAEAVQVMRDRGVNCLLVGDAAGNLIGIFTDRDLLRRVIAAGKPWATPLGEAMTPDPTCVGEKEPVRAAIAKMQQGGYRHLPVLDEAGRPVGVLAVRQIVHYIVEHFPTAVYNLPPNPRAAPTTREGA